MSDVDWIDVFRRVATYADRLGSIRLSLDENGVVIFAVKVNQEYRRMVSWADLSVAQYPESLLKTEIDACLEWRMR